MRGRKATEPEQAKTGERRLLWFVVPALLLFAGLAGAAGASSAVIYKSEACGHCTPYVQELVKVFERLGVSYDVREILNDPPARAELELEQERLGIPLELRGHLVTIVDGKYAFEGHAPVSVVESFLSGERSAYEKIVVFQDSMDPGATSYRVMTADGVVKDCVLGEGVRACDAANRAVGSVGAGGTSASAGAGWGGIAAWQWGVVALILVVPLGLLFFGGRGEKPGAGK